MGPNQPRKLRRRKISVSQRISQEKLRDASTNQVFPQVEIAGNPFENSSTPGSLRKSNTSTERERRRPKLMGEEEENQTSKGNTDPRAVKMMVSIKL